MWTLLPRLTTEKLKESKNKDKYVDLSKELKNLFNMKVTIIPIAIGALGTLPKGIVKGLEELDIGDEWRQSKLQHY